jgi:hypothetical protein
MMAGSLATVTAPSLRVTVTHTLGDFLEIRLMTCTLDDFLKIRPKHQCVLRAEALARFSRSGKSAKYNDR